MPEYAPPKIHRNKTNLQLWWFTALLIAINVGLFAWQVLHGIDITSPSTADAIRWGADYAPLSYLAEPIRLFTSMFFHFGLIHLALNMWALYIFGNIAEQMLGRYYYIGLYMLAGLSGSLLSGYVAIQDSYELLQIGTANPSLLPSVGAGASGAVMGLGAALTVISLFPNLPSQRFLLDKKTLLMVMGINLAMGFTISGINNAAHIGGMLMGGFLALAWYWGEKIQRPRLIQLIALIAGGMICWVVYQYCLIKVATIAPFWHELLQWMTQSIQQPHA
jgi:rhomboid protease GluP